MSPNWGMQACASSIVLRHRLFLSSEMPTRKPSALIACLRAVSATAWLSDMFGKWTTNDFNAAEFRDLFSNQMIDPSEPKWNQDQHHAIDTIIQVAFVRIREIIVTDDEWLIGLWKRLARHYHTDTTAPRGNTHIKDFFFFYLQSMWNISLIVCSDIPLSKAVTYLLTPEDVRFQVIMDILSVILDLDPER